MAGAASEERAIEVVVLCTANRARSPLAAALLRRRSSGMSVHVRSCGTRGPESAPALPGMVTAADRMGVDLRGHRSHVLSPGELADADLVIGFEPSHTAAAVVDGGADRGAVFTLPELIALVDTPAEPRDGGLPARLASIIARANAKRQGADPFRAASIDDPLGGSPQTFERVAREIELGVDRVASSLLGSPSTTGAGP